MRIFKPIILLAIVVCFAGCASDRNLTERTVAQSNAAIANANAQAQISRNEADSANLKTLAEAAKPDNTLLILVLIGVFGIGGMALYWLMKTNYLQAQAMQSVVVASLNAQLSRAQYKVLPEPPHYVQIAARHWQGKPEWDGEQWLIVDEEGRELASERKRIAGR